MTSALPRRDGLKVPRDVSNGASNLGCLRLEEGVVLHASASLFEPAASAPSSSSSHRVAVL